MSRALVIEPFGSFLQTVYENLMSKEKTLRVLHRFVGLKKDISLKKKRPPIAVVFVEKL